MRRIAHFLSDKECLSLLYFLTFRKQLNWKKPVTFNEKLNWLKIYDRSSLYPIIVDKLSAKKYVADLIGEQYIIPTLKVWDKSSDFSIENLPDKFVVKTTHDSGSVHICTDKACFDSECVKIKLEKSLKCDFSHRFREWPYHYVQRKIIAEEYLEVGKGGDLVDYKFFCFNGIPQFLKVDFNRKTNHRANYYSLSWQLLEFGEAVCPPDHTHKIECPDNLSQMIELAKKLSKDIPFVRVDFYNIEGRIYFGEMTLYPAAGFGHFIPSDADKTIGEFLTLPN